MNERKADRITGVAGLALSGTYIAYAQSIEDSLLADEVGAAGVPSGVGLIMLLAAAALFIKASAQGEPTAVDEAPAPSPWRSHQLALGLLAILAVYVLLLPLAGYAVSVALLLAAVGWLAGARAPKTLALSAALGALGLWILFSVVLGIRLPAGLWPAAWGV
jgi:hypothetical protein